MASVTSVQRNMETRFTIELIGDNLDNNHMSKIIKWAVNDFKNKYPLLLLEIMLVVEGLIMSGKSYWPLKFILFIVISVL